MYGQVFPELVIPKEYLSPAKRPAEGPEGAARRVFMNVLIDVDGEGNRYRGEMIICAHRMLPSGLGIMHFGSGAFYEGQWHEGARHGYGRLIQENGNMYEGGWARDLANGYGVFRNLEGYQYEGHWKDDRQEGLGIETWESSN